jgi:hypothetical protein
VARVRRIELANRLTADLDSRFVVVPSPDHPEIMFGPDVLIGGNGRLTALFRIQSREGRQLLMARVVAARLGLPAGARLIALVEPEASHDSVTQNEFDEIIEADDISAIARECSSSAGRLPRGEADLRKVQRQHQIWYSTVFQLVVMRKRREVEASTAAEVVGTLRDRQSLAEGEWVERSVSSKFSTDHPSAVVSDTIVAALAGSSRQSPALRVRSLWAAGLSADFTFDNRVPYQKHFLPRVLLVDAWPSNRWDPDKPARAMAFGGWLMAIPTTADDTVALVGRALEVTERRLNA